MEKMDLIHTFKSMLMVARKYDLEINEKYEELDEHLLEEYDLDAVEMLDSLEKVYQLLKPQVEIEED
jgi:hypothetical protein